MVLKIAVFSDFHCHRKSNNNNIQESYLLVDEDLEIFQDPFKSFQKLINDGANIEADILILPGDFTNKCDPEGLAYGWQISQDIASLLKVQDIIPNIGNHDVDSRKKNDPNPFHLIQNFSKAFPFSNPDDNTSFWKDGYVIIENTNYRILNINTVHSHNDENMAKKGLIEQDALNEIQRKLTFSHGNKINIAVCHHNPIEHSHYNTGSKDFMHNGDELISILDNLNFDIIIHGHKHDPRIRYAPGGANSPTIFSAGSFSAFKNLLLQGANNTFHIITFECSESHLGKGIIDTWFFVPTKGWTQNIKNNFFDSKMGFGAIVDIRALAGTIVDWLSLQQENYMEWTELLKEFKELNYMIPSDLAKLKNELKLKNILISPFVYGEPSFVQFKKS